MSVSQETFEQTYTALERARKTALAAQAQADYWKTYAQMLERLLHAKEAELSATNARQ